MKNQLTYNRKNQILALGSFVLVILAYVFAVSDTISLYQSNKQQELKLKQAENAPQKLRQLQSKLKQYQYLTKENLADSSEQESYTLETLTNLCEQYHSQLVSFPGLQYSHQDSYLISTRTIKLKGDYKGLLQVLFHTEKNLSIGKITGVKFVTEEDRLHNKEDLFMYLYLQNLQPQK